jgi:hypothetical protein
MYILMCNNVDNYPHVCGKWEKSPTKDELVKVLKDYHDNANELADELVSVGSCDVGNSSCTTYEVQSI